MKIIMRTLSVLALAGLIAVAALKQNAIAAARAEREALQRAALETQQRGGETKSSGSSSEASGELEKLREENKELPKLRNEVRQLRRQADELAKLRQENDQLRAIQEKGPGNAAGKSQWPAGFIKPSEFADAGRSSPENTIKTAVWAMFNGNLEKMKECMTPEMAQKLPPDEEGFRQVAEAAKEFPGYRIVNENPVSADEVTVQIEMPDGSGHPMTLKRFGNEWKIESE